MTTVSSTEYWIKLILYDEKYWLAIYLIPYIKIKSHNQIFKSKQ